MTVERYPISLSDSLFLQMHLGRALLQKPAMQRMHIPRQGKAMAYYSKLPKGRKEDFNETCVSPANRDLC